nr:citrate synthase 3, peroxisomal [Quercus suber]
MHNQSQRRLDKGDEVSRCRRSGSHQNTHVIVIAGLASASTIQYVLFDYKRWTLVDPVLQLTFSLTYYWRRPEAGYSSTSTFNTQPITRPPYPVIMPDHLSVVDGRNGESHRLPIVNNAVQAVDFAKIRKSKNEPGLKLLDVGYRNTVVMPTGVSEL